jgi:hypothetical protein
MKWEVMKFMGDNNPVCTDAGDFKVVEEPLSVDFIAGGMHFGVSDKWTILKCGFTTFDPYDDNYDWENHKYRKEIRKNDIYIDLSSGRIPIVSDPRVLMVVDHYFRYGKAITNVPSRPDAVRYLLKEKALYALFPAEDYNDNTTPLTLADLEAQGLTPETF